MATQLMFARVRSRNEIVKRFYRQRRGQYYKTHSNMTFSLLLPKLRFLVRAVVVAQVEAHQTTDQEIVGSIPAARSWAFSLLYPIRSVSLIRSLMEVHHY